jgi:hypothetical protein
MLFAFFMINVGFSRSPEILQRCPEHTEALTILGAQMLVVYKMGFPDRAQICIFRASKPLEALVDKDIVYNEIARTVDSNTEPYPYSKIPCGGPRDKEIGTWDCENQEEGIVLLEEPGFVYMVVLMKPPHKPVHDIFVGEPGYTFHHNKCGQDDTGVHQNVHVACVI